MERMICIVFIFCFACTFHHCVTGKTHYPRIHYMEEECNQTIIATLDMRLRLTFDPEIPLRTNWTCRLRVIVEAPEDRLVAKYMDINTEDSERCRMNALEIFASNGTLLNGPNGNCGTDLIKGEFLSRRYLTFEFHTDSTEQTGNFDLLITPISISKGNGTCPDQRFHCENRRCVSVYVTCNGFDDCGDDTDELDNCSWTSTIIILSVAGALVVAVVISLLIFIFQYRRRKYRRLSRRSKHHSETSYYSDHHHTGGYQNY